MIDVARALDLRNALGVPDVPVVLPDPQWTFDPPLWSIMADLAHEFDEQMYAVGEALKEPVQHMLDDFAAFLAEAEANGVFAD